MFKKVFFGTIDILLNRRQVVRLSKSMLNRALGNNNGNMMTNGEIYLMRQIWDLQKAGDHKFVAFDVGANVGQWASSLFKVSGNRGGVFIALNLRRQLFLSFKQLWQNICLSEKYSA